MNIAVIVYHKNLTKIYPDEWIRIFRQSILSQTYCNFDIVEIDYGGGGNRIFTNSFFVSKALPTFADAINMWFSFAEIVGYEAIFNTNVDDYYSEDRIEKQMAKIKDGYDIVSSNFDLIKDDRTVHRHKFHNLNIAEELAKDHNIICHPVVAYSARFIEDNSYSSELIPLEDMRLWQQTIGRYRFTILEDVLCFHRLHPQSIGHKLKED